MINFRNTKFLKSVAKLTDAPKDNMSELLLVGKSNVGKSSLINAICDNKNLAFTSSKPGHTKLLNYYLVDNQFYIVDAPGYGFAKRGIDDDLFFRDLMNEYFNNTTNLKSILVLLDSRREISQDDLDFINFANSKNLKIILVFTKSDKLNQKEKSLVFKRMDKIKSNLDIDQFYFVSTKDISSLNKLRNIISLII